MATVYWIGDAVAVAQVATVTITADDAATTYIITIGTETVSVAGSGTGVNDTASALQVALEASTHPYFSNIDFTVLTDTVTFTAGTAGVPFVATSSVQGGTGTIGAVTTTTASAGPNDWSTAANWNTTTVPVTGDDIIVQDTTDNIVYGLDQSDVRPDTLRIPKNYTGKLGLASNVFATSADGDTTVDTAVEYRDTYLKFGTTTTAWTIDLGENFGPSQPIGSSRIKIDTGTTKPTITVHDTANSPSETGLPANRFLVASGAAASLFVRLAPGGVGIAADRPDETSAINEVSISDTGTTTKVNVGAGTTINNYFQIGGTNVLQAAATITDVRVDGGELTTEGDFTVTTFTQNGGTVILNHVKTAGNIVTTYNLDGGTLDTQQSTESRTISTLVMPPGGTLRATKSALAISSLNAGGTGNVSYTVSVS